MNFSVGVSLTTVLCIIIAGIALWHYSSTWGISYSYLDQVQKQDFSFLFPSTSKELNTLTKRYTQQIKTEISTIEKISPSERTFANTFLALDRLTTVSDPAIFNQLAGIIEMTNPDEALRATAHEVQKEFNALWIDCFFSNQQIYQACKQFYQEHQHDATLTDEQKRYMKEVVTDFERAGLNLPAAERAQVVKLKKEIGDLTLLFEKNIAADNRTIIVDKEGLKGLGDSFIASLKKTDDGKYILATDYPTYFHVLPNSEVEDTRKRLYIAFSQRAYPDNVHILKQLIEKRDQLAKLVGYDNYAVYDIADQMAKKVERVEEFLDDLAVRAAAKEQKEIAQLIKELPESVVLTADGKIKPWDFFYLKDVYKKKHLQVDECNLTNYFPLDKTIDRLFAIYKKFFSLDFRTIPVHGWHPDVQLIEVLTADRTKILGYLLLDLFPRENKYNHACHATIIPAFIDKEKRYPAVSAVLANFPKATADKPALLKFKDVETFFHEFGHALHAVLGATHMASFSGTHVKRDFVEMPSQMLEEWLSDKEILKQVSCHYQTGKPLPDAFIDSLIALKKFDSGIFIQTQIFYSRMSLEYFKRASVDDPQELMREFYVQYRPHVLFHPDYHMYASFGHLTNYGPKYYGYLWSKVFAIDLFKAIEKEGLLNPVTGARYVDTVIGKGGSKDPDELLKDFLGRKPQPEPFFENLGL